LVVARVPEAQPAVAASSAGPAFQSDRGATSSAFGASVADAVVRLGQTASTAGDQFAQVALRIQTEDNERAAKDMDVKYAQALSAIGSGDGTEANPGFYATRGQNSIDQYEKVKETQRKARQKITEGSTNAGVLSRFNASADSRDVSENTAMGRHVAAQREAANDATGQARLDIAISDASRKWTDDSAFNENLAIITGEVSSLMQRKGLSPEVAVQLKLQATTQAVAGAFHAALAAEDTGRAADILTTRKGLVEGTELAKLRKELRTQGLAVAAQTLVDEARILYPLDPGKQRDHIRAVAEGEVENKAITDLNGRIGEDQTDENYGRALIRDAEARANHAHAEDQRQRIDAINAATDTARDFVESGRWPGDLPATVRQHLTTAQFTALEARARQLKLKEPVKTDNEFFVGVMKSLPEDLAALPGSFLDEARAKLGDAEYGIVRTRVANAQISKNDATAATTTQLINSQIQAIYGPTTKINSKEIGLVEVLIQEELIAAEAANGSKALTEKERRDIILSITDPLIVENTSWWGRNFNPTSEVTLGTVVVPAEDAAAIRQAFKGLGRPAPTEAEIVRQYVAEGGR